MKPFVMFALVLALNVGRVAVGQTTTPARAPSTAPAASVRISGSVLRWDGNDLVVNTAPPGTAPVEERVVVDDYTTIQIDGDFARAAELTPGMTVVATYLQKRVRTAAGMVPFTEIAISARPTFQRATVVSVQENHIVVSVSQDGAAPVLSNISTDDKTEVWFARRLTPDPVEKLQPGAVVLAYPDRGTARKITVTGSGAGGAGTFAAEGNILRIKGRNLIVNTSGRSPGVAGDPSDAERTIVIGENAEFLIDYLPSGIEDLREGMHVSLINAAAKGPVPALCQVQASSKGRSGVVVSIDGWNITKSGITGAQEVTLETNEQTRFITRAGQRVDSLNDIRPGARIVAYPDRGIATKILIAALPPRPASRPTTMPATNR